LAIKATNLFLDNYRVVNDKFYISRITQSIIQNFIIQSTYTDGQKETQYYNFSSGVLHGFGGTLTSEQDITLRQSLKKGATPPILEILDLEIRNKLDLMEWRIASIESAILFETWLKMFLRKQYSSLGLDETSISQKFHKMDKVKTPYS